MKLILIVTKNNEIISNISKIKLKNFNLLALADVKYVKYYLEEYLPEYVIISAKFKNYEDIVEYINCRSKGKPIVIDSDNGKSSIFQNVYLSGIKNLKDLEKVLNIIDDLKPDLKRKRTDCFQFINQQIISFYSIQGGVGKTSIVFNLAWYLKDIIKGKILIIDLNFCEGPSDLNVNLGLDPTPNLSMFIERIVQGVDCFDKSVASLGIDKIDILQPPLSIYQSDKFNIDMLESIIYHARNKYDIILADIPFRYDNITLEMLNLSTTSILVLSPNIRLVPRVNDFQKFLPHYQKKGIIFNKILSDEKKYIDKYKSIIGIPIYEQISFIPAEDRKMIGNKRDYFNILDLQTAMSSLKKFFFEDG